MSSLPSPSKVAGSHLSLYDTYYNAVDPNNHGRIEAMDAAKFLKKSHLSDVVLSKIWDIADPNSCGFLDKSGMFVALKLCALAQQGHSLSISNIHMDIPPPKMGEALNFARAAACPQSSSTSLNDKSWSINPIERAKYEQLFQSMEPVNGYLPGNKVKGVLMDSKLPLKTLGKIWDLADIDKDGKLNQHEFVVAMHLVYKALEKNAVPNVLPVELTDSSTADAADSNLQLSEVASPERIPINTASTILSTETITNKWVVSIEDQKASDKLFVQADEDLDGFVSGSEIKNIFIQSGLSQSILAEIWSLCDISQSGKLNNEQFALAMWLIKQKLNGIDLPNKLLANMIPPSFRKKNTEYTIENNNICSYSNPELDMISKDITEIICEKHVLEQDISQKEADIKIKNGEIKSLQSELDTLAATLRQLDNQKGEAQKRLNDLKAQIDKLRQQAIDQEFTLRTQEDDLNSKRQEIECLKLEENNLELQQNEYKNQLDCLSKQLQKIQLHVSQTKASMTQLEEQQRQLIDAITQYESAFTVGDVSVISDAFLLFRAKLDKHIYIHRLADITNVPNLDNDNKRDLFNNNKESTDQTSFIPFGNNDDSHHDPFNADPQTRKENIKDPFGEDPFAALHAPIRAESPSPALPPKKNKQPPPRPAPPRPTQGLQAVRSSAPLAMSNIISSDPFADNNIPSDSTSNNALDFADFTKFDSKFFCVLNDTKEEKVEDKHKIDISVGSNVPDFEEDPFLDYRYDDLSIMSDPFYDDNETFSVNKGNKKENIDSIYQR